VVRTPPCSFRRSRSSSPEALRASRRLAEAGAQVAVGDVKEDGLAQVVEAARGLPGKVFARKLDVANEAEVGAFVDWASDAMGGSTASSATRGSCAMGVAFCRKL